MAKPLVLTALRRKYAERLGAYDNAALEHLAPVILMFSPDEDISAIQPRRRHKNHRGRKGKLWTRLALDILRTANEPMSAGEIARCIAADQQITGLGAKASIENSLICVFRRWNGQALVSTGSGPRRWSLAPADD